METTKTRAVYCAALIALLVFAAFGSCLCVELTTGDVLYGGVAVTDAAALHRQGEALADTLCRLLPPRVATVVSLLWTEAAYVCDVVAGICS